METIRLIIVEHKTPNRIYGSFTLEQWVGDKRTANSSHGEFYSKDPLARPFLLGNARTEAQKVASTLRETGATVEISEQIFED